MAQSSPYTAEGNITPSRIVKTGTGDFGVLQADAATDPLLGVAHDSTRDTPGLSGASAYAAISGDQLYVYGEGSECKVEAGAAFNDGALLTSDSSGRAIVVPSSGTSNLYSVGRALEAATAAGDLVRIHVQFQTIRPAIV